MASTSVQPEFEDMAKGFNEVLWLRRLLMETSFGPNMKMKLFVTKLQLSSLTNLCPIRLNKHMAVDRHFK